MKSELLINLAASNAPQCDVTLYILSSDKRTGHMVLKMLIVAKLFVVKVSLAHDFVDQQANTAFLLPDYQHPAILFDDGFSRHSGNRADQ